MRVRFRDRREAGLMLAKWLTHYAHRSDVLVLALPRGGVHEVLGMGAIASGDVRVLNRSVIDSFVISENAIAAVVDRERQELKRREIAYRNRRPPPELRDRTVILVDDGIATGSTVRAAISALRQLGAGRIVLATPTVARSTADELMEEVDEIVAVTTPSDFAAVGQWYDEFSQTGDEEVRELLERASRFKTAEQK